MENEKSSVKKEHPLLRSHRPSFFQKGEFCHVERKFSEKKGFSFYGKSKIYDAEDVARIFGNLENASVENAFAVLVDRQDRATVLHLSSGDFYHTLVPIEPLINAVQIVQAKKVFVVHNHPSGNIKASGEDVFMLQRVQRVLQKLVKCETIGIIINQKSGHYGVFNTAKPNETFSYEKKKVAYSLLKVYAFDTLVFDKDYSFESRRITSVQDVAAFLSSHRLGDKPKVNYLILDRANQVMGNFFSEKESLALDLAKTIALDCIRFGGATFILYGNIYLQKGQVSKFEKMVADLTSKTVKMLDMISISKQNKEYRYASFAEGFCERSFSQVVSKKDALEKEGIKIKM